MPGVRRAQKTEDGDAGEGGFTLVEVVLAMTILLIMLLPLAAAFDEVMASTGTARMHQAAVTLADASLDQARSLAPGNLLQGRVQTEVNAQWSAPVSGVDLSQTTEAFAASASNTTPLPTTPQPALVNGHTFDVDWYVGTCLQTRSGGSCTQSAAAPDITLYRVIVAVTWNDGGGCANGCSYVTSTLIDSSPDPVFNTNA